MFDSKATQLNNVKTKQQNLMYLNMGFALLFLFAGGFQQFLTAHFASVGKPNLGFNLLIVLYVTVLVVNTWSVHIIDKLSAPRALVVASACYPSAGFAAYSGNESALYASFALMGAGCAILWGAQNKVLIENTQKYNIGSKAGKFNMCLVMTCILSIVVFSYSLEWFSFENVVMVLTLISSLSIAFFVQVKSNNRIINSELIASVEKLTFTHYRGALVSFIAFFLYGVAIAHLPFKASQLDAAPFFVGAISICFFLAKGLCSTLAGNYIDKFGSARVLFFGSLIAITGFLVPYVYQSSFALGLSAALLGLASASLAPLTMVLPKLIANDSQQAQTIRVFMYAKYIGIITAIALSAWLSFAVFTVVAIGMAILNLWVAYYLPGKVTTA